MRIATGGFAGVRQRRERLGHMRLPLVDWHRRLDRNRGNRSIGGRRHGWFRRSHHESVVWRAPNIRAARPTQRAADWTAVRGMVLGGLSNNGRDFLWS